MPLPISGNDDQDDTNVDTLGEVNLISFTAEPTNIGPFGASTLSWHVEGPAGFLLELNLLHVSKTGEKVVQPAATSTYTLVARAGQARRTLGHVTVSVDTASCESFEPLLNPKQSLEAALKAGVESDPTIYFQTDPRTIGFGKIPQPLTPVVRLSPGKIAFSLRLYKRVDWLPDPSVDIDASFGLTVSDGALIAFAEQVSVSVDVPFWAWALPGAIPGLAIALDGGREDARKSTHNAVEGLVQLINFFTVPSKGKRVRTVRVDDGNNGAGIIEVTACSHDLLLKFAAISAAVIIQ